jgi:hypothetical protein
MFCYHCGKELGETQRLCDQCGSPILRPETPKTKDGRATASLLCGIASWLTCGGFYILPLIGLSLGILELKSKRPLYAAVGILFNIGGLVLALGLTTLLVLPSVKCQSNTKQIVQALHRYHDEHGAFPPLYTVDEEGEPLHSWRVLILPYIGQKQLYEQIRLDEPWDTEHNHRLHWEMPALYQCLGDIGSMDAMGRGREHCHYSAIAGGLLIPATEAGSVIGRRIEDLPDGLDTTAALVETEKPFCWMDPTADVTLNEFGQAKRVRLLRHGWLWNGDNIRVTFLDGSVSN